jgi:hypothetical protein
MPMLGHLQHLSRYSFGLMFKTEKQAKRGKKQENERPYYPDCRLTTVSQDKNWRTAASSDKHGKQICEWIGSAHFTVCFGIDLSAWFRALSILIISS